jgi:hypothetical protein
VLPQPALYNAPLSEQSLLSQRPHWNSSLSSSPPPRTAAAISASFMSHHAARSALRTTPTFVNPITPSVVLAGAHVSDEGFNVSSSRLELESSSLSAQSSTRDTASSSHSSRISIDSISGALKEQALQPQHQQQSPEQNQIIASPPIPTPTPSPNSSPLIPPKLRVNQALPQGPGRRKLEEEHDAETEIRDVGRVKYTGRRCGIRSSTSALCSPSPYGPRIRSSTASSNADTTAKPLLTPSLSSCLPTLRSISAIDRELTRKFKNREASRKSRQRKLDERESLARELVMLREENARLKCADVRHAIEKKELIEGFGCERRRFHMRFVFFYFYCFN